jgi:hypothetical protein
VEHDDSGDNVRALFPGIDTTPFGRGADLAELSDDGWSATPEQSVVVDEPLRVTGRPSGGRSRHMRKMLAGGTVGLALLVGVGVPLAHFLLNAPGARRPDRVASSRSAGKKLAAQLPRGYAGALSVGDQSGRRPSVSRDLHRRAVAHPRRHRRSAASAAMEVSYVPPVQPSQSVGAAAGESRASASSSEPAGNSSAGSSASSGSRAGPTGPVSLIGAGTTPSG